MQQNTTHLTSTSDLFLERYTNMKRLLWDIGIMLLGVIIAGFWNYHLVDGFGRDFIAGRTIGDTGLLAGSYAENGGGFGFVFAAIAGLAATFTAYNCVAFALITGMDCSADIEYTNNEGIRARLALFTP